ncbi:MAG: hypothetical protein MRY74_14105 [Neomegalonema sp.]|nr:hypothetical protein [Neomegalonema sp.]
MAASERYFSGLFRGEALRSFTVESENAVGASQENDLAERAVAADAVAEAERIYETARASIRLAVDAYAETWMWSATQALQERENRSDAAESLRLALDKPLARPADLQATARDLFDCPPEDDAAPVSASFGFDAPRRAEADARRATRPPMLKPGQIGALRAATYPLIALKPRFMDGADLFDPSKDVRLSSYFGIDVTRPHLFRPRLVAGLARLLRRAAAGDPSRAHFEDPRVFVGRSLNHIPLFYAVTDAEVSGALARAYDASSLEDAAFKTAERTGALLGDAVTAESAAKWRARYRTRVLRQCRSDLKYVFVFPDLVDIDDRFVDGDYRTAQIDPARFRLLPSAVQSEIGQLDRDFQQLWRETVQHDDSADSRAPNADASRPTARKIVKPLTPFSAKRVDYALARIEHYTGARPDDFQPYIFFTNYGFYVQTFIQELFQSKVAHGLGKLVAPIDRERVGLPRSSSLGVTLTADLPPELQSSNGGLDILKATTFAPKQMPAIHYIPTSENEPGISIVNIGVGPSNAKTMTDLLAVLAPRAWLMLGHCGGLRRTQEIGQFVLAQAYLRDDHVLDGELPSEIPAPQIVEVQECLMRAIEEVLLEEDADPEKGDQRFIAYQNFKEQVLAFLQALGVSLPDPTRLAFDQQGQAARDQLPHLELLQLTGLTARDATAGAPIIEQEKADAIRAAYKAWRREIRARVRTGTVVTTDDRNWELNAHDKVMDRFERSRAIAVDMESATIAAAGLRYRVPYGALLCVSDKPLMGEPKMRAQADEFYLTATRNHIRIGIETVRHLFSRADAIAQSRKLKSLDDPPIL